MFKPTIKSYANHQTIYRIVCKLLCVDVYMTFCEFYLDSELC